ncbi:MAG TPA: hypothetical protein VF885_09990 [Arthrobacter sp.]
MTVSEAPAALAAILEGHASPAALADFLAASARAGALVDDSLPHLQELLRLALVHLTLERPGIDAGGELERLADGCASDEDLDILNADEAREIFTWILSGDWDFTGGPALAAAVYLEDNPAVDRAVIDAALGTLGSFLDSNTVKAAPAPVRHLVLVEAAPAGELAAAA